MQEVFVVVHRRLPEYEPRHRLTGWLGAIAVKVAKRWRPRRDVASVETLDQEQASTEAALVGDPEQAIAEADELQHLLDELDPDLCFLLLTHHRDGVPIAEIAEHLGEPEGTIKSRLSTARKEFRAAWRRQKARDARAGAQVLSILGPLRLLEADREPPPLPDGVHEKVWNGIQRAIHGGGGGGGGEDGGGGRPTPPDLRPAPSPAVAAGTVAVKLGTLTALVAAGTFVAGVIVGALVDPSHRSRAPSDTATARIERVITAAPPVSAPTAAAAPSALTASSTSALPAVAPSAPASALQSRQGHVPLSNAEERETMWITALLRAGRIGEARERFAVFERLYPGSPRLEEFRAALAAP